MHSSLLTTRRLVASVAATLAVAIGASLALAPTATATPPGIPSPSEARSLLSGLTVAGEGSDDGYDRDRFPHWSAQDGNCNTRETVLHRDGSGVEVGTDCYPTSGSWYSEYDGDSWTDPSDVDIDHVVPLAEAWRSGASGWTDSQREGFANDLSGPQLIAVTDNVNQSKGDQDPAEWMPPLSEYHCTYAAMWVAVKSGYGLTVDSAEYDALSATLNGC